MSRSARLALVHLLIVTCPTIAYGTLWSAPQLFAPANVSNAQDWRVTFESDYLTFYVQTERDGHFANAEIYKSTRPDVSAAWSTPSSVSELNSSAHDHIYWVSQDGTEAFMARHGNPVPNTFGDLYRTTRSSHSNPWSAPNLVSELNSTSFEWHMSLTGDGLNSIFSSTRPGGNGGGFDFWQSSRANTSSAWAIPTPLTSTNSPVDETDPCLSPNGLTLYFVRPGQGIFSATRASLFDPFANVTPTGLPTDSGAPSFSPDGSTIYFSRPNGSSLNHDVYFAVAVPEPTTSILFLIGFLMAARRRRF